MADGDVIYLGWNDLVGITRVRGVPAGEISKRMAYGLGWAVAGQALTPFEDIAPNPWGPMLEVRQTPDPSTETRVDIWPDAGPLHFFLCDSRMPDGSSWECCARGFMLKALDALEAETGLQFMAAFEHEFLLTGSEATWCVPFSLEQVRINAAFIRDVTRALVAAKVELETVEPEYGVLQYEIAHAPAVGAMAGDRAIITREVTREAARRLGFRASFTPKPTPNAVGNGAHVHFSFRDKDGRNATYDPNGAGDPRTGGTSQVAQHFIAGVVRHMRALCALMAPSPVSYLRLGPHHWSCGYNAFGIQNREAAIRVCPSPERDPARKGGAFNLEIRIPDGTASPYMVIGALVNAGLAGIREKLPLPPALDRDPAELSDAE
ncbi:MAG: glutamine synthetase, partial [Rhodospirillaceae bacterium]|nr:glutamine synthetase [Rhodospirillaceae bacterium]